MGSAAAWQLSQYGEKVLLIEQQRSNYKTGSSYGDSRIARSLGPEGDIFSYIQNKSVSEAKRLISFLNTSGNDAMHSMEDIYTTSPVTYVFDETGCEALKALCHEKQTDTYELASSASAYEVFGMTIPEPNTVIREYGAYSGTINPKVLISKLHAGIRQYKNRLLFEHKIVDISLTDTGYQIETLHLGTNQTKTFVAEKLVVAAGPFTGKVLNDFAPDFKELIVPKRVFSTFFKIKTSIYQAYTDEEKNKIRRSQPSFFQYDNMFYSMIDRMDDDGTPVFKTGGHAIHDPIENLDACWEILPSVENIEWSRERMYRYLKMLNIPLKKEDIEYIHGQSCVYSLTATGIPLVTSVKREINNSLVVMGGMSGIGAKGSLCYGLIAANLLLGKKEDDPMYIKTADALTANLR